MPRDFSVSIVLGPPPSRKNPIRMAQLEALASVRSDVAIGVGETGTRAKRDTIVIDPTGKVSGVLTLIDGRLEIWNPDEGTLQWMLDLAAALNARVVDNMRRTYRTPHDKYIHPDDAPGRELHLSRIKAARSKRRTNVTAWAIWAIGGLLVLAFAIGFIRWV